MGSEMCIRDSVHSVPFFSALDGSRKIGKPLSTLYVERLASTFYGERDRISTEGTRYEGVCREAHET